VEVKLGLYGKFGYQYNSYCYAGALGMVPCFKNETNAVFQREWKPNRISGITFDQVTTHFSLYFGKYSPYLKKISNKSCRS